MRWSATFRRRCAATPEAVRNLLIAFDGFLTQTGQCPAQIDSLRIVAAEALNNVVEHAYAGRDVGSVGFLCAVERRGIICRISDRGRPLDQLPKGIAPDLTGNLPEGGFGWFLIHQLATHIRYQRIGSRNLLSFAVLLENPKKTAAAKTPYSFPNAAGNHHHN